jgi:deazaflavin-dependent oxidoreductase (nitroreductase family)
MSAESGFTPLKFFAVHILNPFMRRFAGRSRTPFALVRHVGRKSGKPYETPVIVEPRSGYFILALTYGREVDWVKNVLAAGRCGILYHGKEYAITRIEVLDAPTGLASYRQPFRSILLMQGTSDFLKMTYA